MVTITEIATPEPTPEPDPEPEPEPDDAITSSVYVVTTTMIDQILPDTNISTFKENIATEVGYRIVNTKGEELNNTDIIGTGDQLITDTNKTYSLIVTGDLNGDGNITITDMSMMRKHYLEIESLYGVYLKSADMDHNDKISLNDVAIMRKNILKIDL